MARFPYLMNRSGYYYFRIAVPLGLMNVLGRAELCHSLKTKDYAEAIKRSMDSLTLAQEAFQKAQAGSPDTAKAILNQALYRPIADDSSPVTIPDNAVPLFRAPQSKGGERLSQVFGLYLGECKGDRAKTLQKKKATLALWLDVMGDLPLKEITKAIARDFKQVLMKLPNNVSKRYRGQSIKDINLDAVPEGQRLAVKSVNIQLGYMRAFINWAISNGHYEAANPFSGLALKETTKAQDKRLAFSPEQLKAIFTSPELMGDRGSFYWVAYIALYSGARMQEICQLYIADLKQIEGIWVFDFNSDGNDKQLKNESSKRKTPVHPKLIDMGLLEYVEGLREKGEKRLFPDLPLSSDGTYSNIFSKRFNLFLKRRSIKVDKVSFHSFRHTFIDALRNTNVHREVREALVGHLERKTAHDSYGSAIGVKRLYEGVCMLGYEYAD